MFKKAECINGINCIVVYGLGEYDIGDTMECGQCFRFERIESKETLTRYVTTAYGHIIDVGQRERGEVIFFTDNEDFVENIGIPYFNLDTDLGAIKEDIINRTDSEWLKNAASAAGGIAILKQEPFETLISFIISQNNNIPRIRKIVRQICSEYGVNLALQNRLTKCPYQQISATPCEEKCKECGRCYTFPTATDILKNPEGLAPSRPGFRYGYILDACQKVVDGSVNLDMIAAARSYTHTVECLKQIKGVGDKVASCVALFGFGNLDAFPIDVWMKRAIDTYFDGKLDVDSLGRYRGMAQQYIFHYIRNIESVEK